MNMKHEKRSLFSDEKPKKKLAEEPRETKAEEANKIDDELNVVKEEARSHYDKLLRVSAEFENYKKRSEKETESICRFANVGIVGDVLPILDDLDRLLEHSHRSDDANDYAEGAKLVRKNLLAALTKNGLKEMEDAVGKPFDPNMHEAINHTETDTVEPGCVAAVLRKGYILHDRVVRAAMVTVAK